MVRRLGRRAEGLCWYIFYFKCEHWVVFVLGQQTVCETFPNLDVVVDKRSLPKTCGTRLKCNQKTHCEFDGNHKPGGLNKVGGGGEVHGSHLRMILWEVYGICLHQYIFLEVPLQIMTLSSY